MNPEIQEIQLTAIREIGLPGLVIMVIAIIIMAVLWAILNRRNISEK